MPFYLLKIITPLGKVFDGQVEAVVAPGAEGLFGILANHAAMAASLKEGILKITQNQQDHYFSLGAGILEVDGCNSVLILADYAFEGKNQNDTQNKIHGFTSHY